MAWSDPKTWTADVMLTASDLNQYVSDNLSALYALVQGGGRKNLLHNGACQVHQRSAVGVGVASITTGGYYTADRWIFDPTAFGTWTQSVEADAPTGSGFRKSLKVLCTTADASPAAGDALLVQQRLEGQNLQSVKKGTASAEPLTLSFWVKSNKTGTYVVELLDADNSNRIVCGSYTVDASGTWEQKSMTFPADLTGAFDNDANASAQLNFWLGAGSNFTTGTLATTWQAYDATDRAVGQTNLAASTNNYWQITGCQLEVGSAATGFEFKGFEQELSECQRYYYRAYGGYYLTAGTTDSLVIDVPFPVTMRTVPTSFETSATDANFNAGSPSATQWGMVRHAVAWMSKSSGTVAIGVQASSGHLHVTFTGMIMSAVPNAISIGLSLYLAASADL